MSPAEEELALQPVGEVERRMEDQCGATAGEEEDGLDVRVQARMGGKEVANCPAGSAEAIACQLVDFLVTRHEFSVRFSHPACEVEGRAYAWLSEREECVGSSCFNVNRKEQILPFFART
jgi:hypothetical protein